jgi:hypothetical protein
LASPFKLSPVNALRTKAGSCIAFPIGIISLRESIASQNNGERATGNERRHGGDCRPVDCLPIAVARGASIKNDHLKYSPDFPKNMESISALADFLPKTWGAFPRLRISLPELWEHFRACGFPPQDLGNISALADFSSKTWRTFPRLRISPPELGEHFRACGFPPKALWNISATANFMPMGRNGNLPIFPFPYFHIFTSPHH